MIASMLKTKKGRVKLAQEYALLFRMHRDYVGKARKFLRVDPIGTGVPSTYDIDPDFGAFSYDDSAQSVLYHLKVSRIEVPIFSIQLGVEESFGQTLEARYSVADRMRDRGKAEVVREEDSRAIAAISAASTVLGTGTYTPPSGTGTTVGAPTQVTPEAIVSAMTHIESYNLRVRNSVWNPKAMTWFRTLGREFIDPVHQQELVDTGLLARWQGMNIFTSVEVTNDATFSYGYIMCSPEHLGRIPLRKDIHVIPLDDPLRLTIGFNIFEYLGMAVLNPNGVVKLGFGLDTFWDAPPVVSPVE